MKHHFFYSLAACALLTACVQVPRQPEPVRAFIEQMADRHRFSERELGDLFAGLTADNAVIAKMTTPAEALPWHRYRKIFLTEQRISDGLAFWRDNALTLADIERRYGVPAEIIVAIIGVETRYGRHTGKHRVLDALYTLAFFYPKRAAFFQSELENYLLLCREENLDPKVLQGSYAGAMGMPQFMPSSFRNYAADFDRDGRRDIWHNNADVMASIAQYFARHGWQAARPIAVAATATGSRYKNALSTELKPDLRLAELESLDLKIPAPLALDVKAKILELKQEQGEELWVVFDNFYCLTRYNHSPLYAMAVYQLSLQLRSRKAL